LTALGPFAKEIFCGERRATGIMNFPSFISSPEAAKTISFGKSAQSWSGDRLFYSHCP
jgi:hypothetical protein